MVFNPISKESKLKALRFGADVVLISRNMPDFNGKDLMKKKDKEPFVIDGPGEYEIKSVFIKGTESRSVYGSKEGINTIYSIKMEGINMVFFGVLSDEKPDMSFVEDMDSVDIAFVPIGGGEVLDTAQAIKLAVSLESKIIIPTHFNGLGPGGALKEFKEEAGGAGVEELDKLTIKKKDLEQKNGEFVVLKA